MDVGTGWALDMPIALFLSGAARIQTFDLHAYLRPKRVEQTLDSIRGMRDQAMETLNKVSFGVVNFLTRKSGGTIIASSLTLNCPF